MTNIWGLLGPSPFAGRVDTAIDALTGIALDARMPYELNIRVTERYVFVEFKATADNGPDDWNDHRQQLRQLLDVVDSVGHTYQRESSTLWVRIGADDDAA